MPTGKIRWFNHQIGFIRSDKGENIFFRSDDYKGKDVQAIREGQQVRFDIAKDIRSLSQKAASVTTAI
jgi:cold shock CspA family protein